MTLCGVGGVGWWCGYDQLCCTASPKLLLGLDLGLGCNNGWKGFAIFYKLITAPSTIVSQFKRAMSNVDSVFQSK